MELINRRKLDARRPTQNLLSSIALGLAILVTWELMHHYTGLARDGSLYAVQAFAQIHPALYHDLSLMHNSQDHYTIFSPLYGFFIGLLGLPAAETTLFVVCFLWFLAAAWSLARDLTSDRLAWLAVAMLVVIVGTYGAYSIFSYSETYLTARSMAEALVITSLAVHFSGKRIAALAIAACAMLVHPLMALPGVLLLIFLGLTFRNSMAVAAAGLVATFLLAVLAKSYPHDGALQIMDGAWLEVVRERSQFLFLNYWKFDDWEMHVRVFLCLALSAVVIDDRRIFKLCVCAILLGLAGLGVALIAGAIGPVAILLQGQAWRWFWVSEFVCILLLGATALTLWKDKRCGALCATLFISGWTFAPVHGTAVVALAMMLWLVRKKINFRNANLLRWGAYGLMLIILAWTIFNAWSIVTAHQADTREKSAVIDHLRSIFAMQIPAVLVFGLLWYLLTSVPRTWLAVAFALLLAIAAWDLLPGTFNQILDYGSQRQVAEFADWRAVIPEQATVLMIGPRKTAAFIWFTLQRPAYLSVDQSSGVVFSRATALEIKRRSEVLLPIEDPNWKILSFLQGKKNEKSDPRPLTAENLAAICSDPELGFVAAKESVGYPSISHSHAGSFTDWNLYDCERVRSAEPSA